MRRVLLFAFLVTAPAVLPVRASQPVLPAGVLGADGQVVVRRATLPRDRQPVAEVRLVRRGHAVVVETVVSTYLFRRVVEKIRRSEKANWPEGSPGHDDSARYVRALESFGSPGASPRDLNERRNRRVQMAIEFILTAEAGWVVLSKIDLDGPAPTGPVNAQHPVTTLVLSRAYVERNMALIAADAFGLDEGRARDLVASLEQKVFPPPAGSTGEK